MTKNADDDAKLPLEVDEAAAEVETGAAPPVKTFDLPKTDDERRIFQNGDTDREPSSDETPVSRGS
jgi:hypothetical protein